MLKDPLQVYLSHSPLSTGQKYFLYNLACLEIRIFTPKYVRENTEFSKRTTRHYLYELYHSGILGRKKCSTRTYYYFIDTKLIHHIAAKENNFEPIPSTMNALNSQDIEDITRYKQLYKETKDPVFRKALQWFDNGKTRKRYTPVQQNKPLYNEVRLILSTVKSTGLTYQEIIDKYDLEVSMEVLSSIFCDNNMVVSVETLEKLKTRILGEYEIN